MTLLSYNEFERAVQLGEVKDITPYLDSRAQTQKGYWTSLNNISVSCSPARTTIGLEKRSFSLLCWETNDLPTTRKVPNGALPHTPISI